MVVVFQEFLLFFAVVEDFEKEHPDELVDALRVAVNARVLPHDVLNRFYRCADRHG